MSLLIQIFLDLLVLLATRDNVILTDGQGSWIKALTRFGPLQLVKWAPAKFPREGIRSCIALISPMFLTQTQTLSIQCSPGLHRQGESWSGKKAMVQIGGIRKFLLKYCGFRSSICFGASNRNPQIIEPSQMQRIAAHFLRALNSNNQALASKISPPSPCDEN